MTYSLSNLRKSSASTEKLQKALAATSNKFKKDERYWEFQVDKAGNGFATIRFLDAPHVDGKDGLPFVRLFTHGFQGPGGWYIENSLTTLEQNDPVSEYNSKLWNTGIEANKKIARDQKRQLKFVSNILVIKDPANPDNEGKVFLFTYGKEIFDKIQERLPGGTENPDPDFLRFNPYDFWNGASFKLKARKKESGYRTYDKSEFAAPGPIASSDEEIEKIWKSAYSLTEVIDPKNFKTYEQLKARLDKVLGVDGSASGPVTQSAEEALAAEVADATGGAIDDEELDVFRRLAAD